MKKYKVIIQIFIVSLFSAIMSSNSIINNAEFVLQVIYSILGLCITAYAFICSPVSEVVNKNKELYDSAYILIAELEDDMSKIFYFSIVITFLEIFKTINFPFIVEPQNLDFNLFVMQSPKMFLINFMMSFLYFLCMYTFYDLIKSTFKIIKGILLKK